MSGDNPQEQPINSSPTSLVDSETVIAPNPPTPLTDPIQSPTLGDASSQPSDSHNSIVTSRKPRAQTSDVWNHFKKIIIKGAEKAECLHCGRRYCAGKKVGTSSLWDHIRERCTKKNAKVDVRQQILNYNRKLDGTARVENHNFNQDVSRKELVNMVIMHEYPLSIVDHIGFQRYSTSLNPNFKLISRSTLRRDIMKMHVSERAKLKSFLENYAGRIALTTDMWTASHQKKGYMAITAHYIDRQWNLHNKILRFAYVPSPHTTEVLAEVLLQTASIFNIHEKVSAVVVDNHITNDGMLELLRQRFDSSTLLLKGAFLHVRCSAHIVNLVVQDGLDIISGGIKKLRDCVSFWTASPKRIQMFEDKARVSKIDYSKKLALDCKTRWNSTFLMLQTALPYKDVFCKLKIQHPRFSFEVPTNDEWKWAAYICDKLVLFYKVTEVFSGRLYPTANLFFRKVCEIKLALMEWLSDSDEMIRKMAEKMVHKFDKYWLCMNGILAVAAILDPRDKMESVEYYFERIYGEDAFFEIDKVKSVLFELLEEYKDSDKEFQDQECALNASSSSSLLGKRPSSSTFEDAFSLAKKGRKKKTNVRSELEFYLDDPAFPDCDEFNVLTYWKNDLKYPTLRKIAKDILAIPASTVASESAFSMGGRVVSAHRSSLNVDTVEALMCLSSWIRGDYEGTLDGIPLMISVMEDEDIGEQTSEITNEIIKNSSASTSEFFLVTNPEVSGSPPRRAPPAVPIIAASPILSNLSKSEDVDEETFSKSESLPENSLLNSESLMGRSFSKAESLNSNQVRELTVDDIEDFEDDDDLDEIKSRRISRRIPNDASDLALALPPFATGINDDDLRETAYEILLACAGASGGLIIPSKEKKKEKKSKLLRKLGRSRNENFNKQSERAPGLIGLLDTMRIQMEVSEDMDIRSRQGLLNALVGKAGKRMDTLLVPLELLSCISRTEFPDKKTYIRWQKRQLNMLEEGLLNHPAVGFGELGRKASEMRILLAKIEESEFLPASTGEIQRSECLKSLHDAAIPLAERPARGDITGEVCHWADGYHLNIRLYEKLLTSVFDVLDDGKLTEEVEEILELLKSTWRVLGMTETTHYTCYAWILFRQFVITREKGMLKHAIEQLKRIPLKEQRGPQERLHLKYLQTKVEGVGSQTVSFLEAYLTPIKKWADRHLGDYHINFAEDSVMMEYMITVAVVSRQLLLEEPAMQSNSETDQDQIEMYISASIKSAFSRTLQTIDTLAETLHEPSLTVLAEETKKLLKKETTLFVPILSQWHPQATVVSVSLLHKLYGMKLKPFLDSAEHLTEDVTSIFPAADSLEQYAMALLTYAYGEDAAEVYFKKLARYKIETLSGTLVMRWVNAQLARLIGWVERAIQQEKWDPISPQQRHGSSIVEVYRIVEETVDQFFALQVPMGNGELNSVVRGVDNAFQVYAKHIVCSLARKEELIPPVPPLTRYRKETGIKAFVKKELLDQKPPEERRSRDITVLPTPMLCVQLNTLHYAVSHLIKLEDSISSRWLKKNPSERFSKRSPDSKSFSQNTALDGSRKDLNAAIDRICEYTGTKIVFIDLGEPFIDNLYRSSVSQSRMEVLVDPLDTALNQLCGVIVEQLRDRIVTSLLQSCLDGLLRVLLDGGPSRVFSPTDARMLEEDLDVLKEFFISGGDGLPRGLVENLVAHARHIIKLHGYETRELIDDLRSNGGSELHRSRSKLDADAKTLLRILCHRNDSEASQYLKKQYKIPKSVA